ncbi:MAG: phosphoglycerate dehydrogenase [Planctomycetes bacterium]|nr:phosphoglycerate dehydrogenase [Planctomycetota bacterium]
MKVVLTEHLDDAAAQWLAERVNFVRVPLEDEAALCRELADADGLIVRTYTQVNDALLDRAPSVRVVGRAGVGLDNIDLEACRRRFVRVVYTPDANTQAVIEYVWALIFDVLRPRKPLPSDASAAVFHHARTEQVGRQADELTLGILGMGRIGKRMAKVADAFGVKVICNDLLSREQLGLPADHPGTFVDKETLWRESDILTIHTDGRAANRNLIDAAVLKQIKPACLLINAARGMLVDAVAMAKWSNRVAGAGGRAILDVHDPEPPPPTYPLWGHSNVQLMAHLASRTHTAMANMSWVVRDVLAVLEGREPKFPAP